MARFNKFIFVYVKWLKKKKKNSTFDFLHVYYPFITINLIIIFNNIGIKYERQDYTLYKIK